MDERHLVRSLDDARGQIGGGAGWHDTLAAFELARNADLDGARVALGRVFNYDGFIDSVDEGRDPGQSVVRAVKLSLMSLGYLRLGAATRVYTAPSPYYHVNVALSGHLSSYFGGQRVVARPDMAAVNAAGQVQRIPDWGTDVEMLFLSIPRQLFETELGSLVGRSTALPGLVEPQLDLAQPLGRSWFMLLELLLRELDADDSMSRVSQRHREELERLVLRGLIRAATHDLSDEARGNLSSARWDSVRRVAAAIEAEPERRWMLSDLARVAGVSGRRLQQAFHDQLGQTPLGYVQEVRLQRARHDLLDGVARVTEVSGRWGFSHLGRFAASYRERFGESPSETGRRVRSVLFDRTAPPHSRADRSAARG